MNLRRRQAVEGIPRCPLCRGNVLDENEDWDMVDASGFGEVTDYVGFSAVQSS